MNKNLSNSLGCREFILSARVEVTSKSVELIGETNRSARVFINKIVERFTVVKIQISVRIAVLIEVNFKSYLILYAS